MQFTYSTDYLGDGVKFLADSSNGSSYPSARKGIAAALAAHGLIKLTFLGACARYSDMQSTGARALPSRWLWIFTRRRRRRIQSRSW